MTSFYAGKYAKRRNSKIFWIKFKVFFVNLNNILILTGAIDNKPLSCFDTVNGLNLSRDHRHVETKAEDSQSTQYTRSSSRNRTYAFAMPAQ